MNIDENEYRYLFFVAFEVARKATDEWFDTFVNASARAALHSDHPDWATKEDTTYLLRRDINYILRTIPYLARENPNFLSILGTWLLENANTSRIEETMEVIDRLTKIMPKRKE